jgi:hypothetical protein
MCPACGHRFLPWNTWRITRFSCVPCPGCGEKLNRRIDAQFFLTLAAFAVLGALLVVWALRWRMPQANFLVFLGIAAVVTWLIDVLTVRLVASEKVRK